MPRAAYRLVLRNVIEFAAIFALWGVGLALVERFKEGRAGLLAVVVLAIAWAKTAFFGIENLRQLRQAAREDVAYHKFMILMVVNMVQIIFSFALDYHVLDHLDEASFAGVREDLAGAALVFEFFYYSALNFMFFGYGDVTPQSVPAKLLTLSEITLAFITVIFLLSDFISLKESIRAGPGDDDVEELV